jgi:hypothetical protein
MVCTGRVFYISHAASWCAQTGLFAFPMLLHGVHRQGFLHFPCCFMVCTDRAFCISHAASWCAQAGLFAFPMLLRGVHRKSFIIVLHVFLASVPFYVTGS